MKIISIGTGQKIFENDSAVRQRQIEYGKLFDELHIIVFTPNDNKFESQKLSENVFLYPTKSKTRIFYVFDFIRLVKKILKASKRDETILTCQDPFETGLVGAILKLRLNLPLHIQIHTDLMHKYFRSQSLLNTIRFYLAEFVIRYSDRVRVVSERIKSSIEQLFPKNSIDVLPIKTEIRTASGGVDKPFHKTLLMVCRLEKEKNIETVFAAIKNLDDKNIGLCLVGDGSQKSSLEKMAKNMGILDRVAFIGWKDDLAPYYKMADVFVSASLYEGYGVSTVEAAYFGKPLILSQTGIAGGVFRENESAFVCDAKDANCFSVNAAKICHDKTLAERVGEAARKSAEVHLDGQKDYLKNYAGSIFAAGKDFIRRNAVSRLIRFGATVFNSFIFLRYFVCGITAAATNIILLYLFTDIFDIWYLYSSVLSFLLALIVSFTLQKFVVFRDSKTDSIHYQFSKFFIAAILGIATNTALVFVCVEVFDIWYIFSQIIAGIFVMIQNFALYKLFIFNKK